MSLGFDCIFGINGKGENGSISKKDDVKDDGIGIGVLSLERRVDERGLETEDSIPTFMFSDSSS